MIWDRASTYVGVALVVSVLWHEPARELAFPLALCVCLYGCLDTLLLEIPWKWQVASLIAHVAIPLVCTARGPPALTTSGIALAAAVLLGVLSVYLFFGRWPYVLSRPVSVGLVLALLAALWLSKPSHAI